MSSRGPYRRHAPQFKLQLCQDIRSGALGRRDARKKYRLSASLVQLWLTQYDRGELDGDKVEASVLAEYEAKIAERTNEAEPRLRYEDSYGCNMSYSKPGVVHLAPMFEIAYDDKEQRCDDKRSNADVNDQHGVGEQQTERCAEQHKLPNEWKGLPRPELAAERRAATKCHDGKCEVSSTHSEGEVHGYFVRWDRSRQERFCGSRSRRTRQGGAGLA
jgi:hypothetical protein